MYPFDELCLFACSTPLVYFVENGRFTIVLCHSKCPRQAFIQLTRCLKAACGISVFVSFAHSMFYISQSHFDTWVSICDLRERISVSTYIPKGLILDVLWQISPKQSLRCSVMWSMWSALKIWRFEQPRIWDVQIVSVCVCLHPLSVSPPGFQSWRW